MAAIVTAYNNFRKILGKSGDTGGPFDYTVDVIKAIVLNSTYTPNYDTDKFLSDVSAKEVTANGCARQTLTTKTWTAGANKFIAKSDPVTQTASGGSITARYVAFFKDTGTAGTSPLLWLLLPDSTPADVVIPDTGVWTETCDPTNGWFYI